MFFERVNRSHGGCGVVAALGFFPILCLVGNLAAPLEGLLQLVPFGLGLAATATYHDSCSGLRELGIKTQPRALLDKVGGLKLVEGAIPETCCGFGGLFCVKYPDISEKMVDAKTDDILKTEADLLLAGDLGCLMNMAGRLKRRGSDVQVRHIAEVLAGMTDTPAIGEGEEEGTG